MNKQPFFSIITCTYKQEKTIAQTVESVFGQTFSEYELIIIDGNSTNKTQDILQKYQKLTSGNIKIFKFPPKGISDAMNNGIAKAKGKYLIFLHSDDFLYSPDVLKRVYLFLNSNPDLDWIYGKINVIDKDSKGIGIFPTRIIFQKSFKKLLNFFNYIPHQAVFIKKDVFVKFGLFDTKLKICMDYELWLRLAEKTKFKFINEIVSSYRLYSDSKSGNPANQSFVFKEKHTVRKKYLNILELIIADFIEIAINIISKMNLRT
jgi:glycosyltransferase involved in cell wall biosynthesis